MIIDLGNLWAIARDEDGRPRGVNSASKEPSRWVMIVDEEFMSTYAKLRKTYAGNL